MRSEILHSMSRVAKVSQKFLSKECSALTNDDDASSSRTIAGALIRHLAHPTRCRSPPDRRTPRSPTMVSSLSGRESTKSPKAAERAAS